jgi:hypothetical protein
MEYWLNACALLRVWNLVIEKMNKTQENHLEKIAWAYHALKLNAPKQLHSSFDVAPTNSVELQTTQFLFIGTTTNKLNGGSM